MKGPELSRQVQEKIFSERASLLFENARSSNMVVIIASSLLAVVLWQDLGHAQLTGWLCFMLVMVLMRGWQILLQHRHPSDLRIDTWVKRYIATTAILGLGWAWAVYLGYQGNDLSRTVAMLTAIGIASLAVPVLVSFPRAVYLYTLPPVLTLILMLTLEDRQHALIALCILIYLFLLYRSVSNLHRMLLESLQLRFQNQALATHLSSEKEKADSLNVSLQQEVAERKQAQHALNEHQKNLEEQIAQRTSELLEAKEAAEAASEAKSNFLATMSHEIRTPINGLLGMTELLSASELNQKQQHLANTALHSGRALLDVINNILDFSKIEAGKLELEYAPFSPRELVRGVVLMLGENARAKQLEIHYELPEDIPDNLLGDETRTRQILINLVGNAIKFTAQGEVRLRTIRLDDNPDACRLRFEVTDTGVGIKAEAIIGIFDAFSQEDGSTTRRFGGSGLGLSISKQLVELMQGEIGVESVAEQGSTFWFSVPFHIEQRAERDKPGARQTAFQPTGNGEQEAIQLTGRNILLVDDNLVNQAVAQGMLELMGCQVRIADTGKSALDACLQERFDLILMDCYMPEMDGFEAAGSIRQQASRNAGIPIIALTADVQKGVRELCHTAGMDDYLSKPFELGDLKAMLKKWLPEYLPETT
jgi:signal transduction histidine kinase/ActR/RegA family two-component response regulator